MFLLRIRGPPRSRGTDTLFPATTRFRSSRSTGARTRTVIRAGNVATATADSAAYRPDEIVVTAQKRVESVQDVPIVVSVLSQQDLNDQKIEGGPDILQIGRASCRERVCQYV